MKRLILATLLLLALLMQPALAVNDTARADHTIELPGAEITFTSPEGFLCLTRETSASVFNRWGMSQRETFAFMEEWDIYALIYDLESGALYQIEVYPFDSMDYDVADETELQLLNADMHKWLRESGYEVTMTDIYRSAHHVYGMAEILYTYEDDYVERSLLMYTCQGGYEVDVYVWPPEGARVEEYRADAKAFVDTLSITRKALPVTTEETPEGQFILRRGEVKLTFTPMDVRYCLTRESSRYLFNRMGGNREAALADMERISCYAILQDSRQRVYANVIVADVYGAQPYDGMADWMMLATEKRMLTDNGWTIKSCSVLDDSAMCFVKSLIYCAQEDGTKNWQLVYGCYMEDLRLEIAVLGSGEKTLEAAQAETDAFVRSIQYEETRK